ncbi:MAG: hypothetical protein RL095_2894 [Verrucomicrobiota bacterium]
MTSPAPRRIAVIGAGPAGLAAAEVLAEAGHAVFVFESGATPARKYLRAGVGGLNITHSEPLPDFYRRYGQALSWLRPHLEAFPPGQVRDWLHRLGIPTFVGSSGRVFPQDMRAAPSLRAWLLRLAGLGVKIRLRHRWLGWNCAGACRFATPNGELQEEFDGLILATGGATWQRLGSDGSWTPLLGAQDVSCKPFRPANCGFECDWTPLFAGKFSGTPVKAVKAALQGTDGAPIERQGEFVITEKGIEGSLVYALSAPLRDAIEADGHVDLWLDLAPDRNFHQLFYDLSLPRGKDSLSNHLRKRGIDGVKAGLLREVHGARLSEDPARLAVIIKNLPIRLRRCRPLDEAISCAGGIPAEELTPDLMLKKLPGVFACGEMLDWEAPTGGYLLTACLATGRGAARGLLRHLAAPG